MSELQLEEGCYYRTDDGMVAGPMKKRSYAGFTAVSHGSDDRTVWTSYGRCYVRGVRVPTLDVREKVNPPESPNNIPIDDDPKVEVGGLLNSKVPPYHLIPPVVPRVLAAQFQKGVDRLGDKAWNAQSEDQSPLLSFPALLERMSHLQNHLLEMAGKMLRKEPIDVYDDPAAILWGAAYIVASIDAIRSQENAANQGQ